MSRQKYVGCNMARIIDGENKNLIGGNLKKLRTKTENQPAGTIQQA